MTNTELLTYTVHPLDPARGWKRPELAAKTLLWVGNCKPSLFRRCVPSRLEQRRYDSLMDLVANGLVERRNHFCGRFDGASTLHLTELGTARLVKLVRSSCEVVTGSPFPDAL
jgi:hypothetical protein